MQRVRILLHLLTFNQTLEIMKTIEGNILIALFMASFNDNDYEVLKHDLKKAGTAESLHYHDSWDWLMPVVEKIDMILLDDEFVMISYNRCFIDNFHEGISFEGCGNSRIKATWNCICEYIQWFDEHK